MWRSRMFWRLFATYGLLLLAAIVGLGIVVVSRVERYHHEQLDERFRIKALLVRELVRAHEDQPLAELDATLRRLRPDGLPRVTLVDEAGKVLLDTDADAAHMDNHGDRPEIAAARLGGFGSATRASQTSHESYGYAAVRIPATRQGVSYIRIATPLNAI